MITHEELTQRVSYDPDTGIFRWKISRGRGVAGRVAGSKRADGYITVGVGGTRYLAHRLAWLLTYNAWPQGIIDHINGDPSYNRIANLREASSKENQLNRRSARRSTSKAVGVSWFKPGNKWRARVNGVSLGYFTAESDAIDAVIAYRRKHLPEFSEAVIATLQALKETL